MEHFGIIKFKRTRTGDSWKMHDYVIDSINSDSGVAFTVNDERRKRLEAQGMKDGAIGNVSLWCSTAEHNGRDYNRITAISFKVWDRNANKNEKEADAKTGGNEKAESMGEYDLPF